MAQFKPADHSKGDANTIGGYAAVHDRPAAFDGPDGFSYSVALMAEPTGEPSRPWAAYILFVRWARIGAQTPEGHLETDHLAHGATESEALGALGATSLADVKCHLDALVLGLPSPSAAPSKETRTSAAPASSPTPASAPGSAAAPAAPSNETRTSVAPKARRWYDGMRNPPPEDDA